MAQAENKPSYQYEQDISDYRRIENLDGSGAYGSLYHMVGME